MSFGVLILRLLVGLTLATHGSQKLFKMFGGSGPAGTSAYFSSLGFRAPMMMAVLAGIAEFGGGLLFAAGLLTPLASIALMVVMFNAIGTEHWSKGYFDYAGGYEYNLLIAATAFAVCSIGVGRYSIDYAIGWAGDITGVSIAFGALAIALVSTAITLSVGRTHGHGDQHGGETSHSGAGDPSQGGTHAEKVAAGRKGGNATASTS